MCARLHTAFRWAILLMLYSSTAGCRCATSARVETTMTWDENLNMGGEGGFSGGAGMLINEKYGFAGIGTYMFGVGRENGEAAGRIVYGFEMFRIPNPIGFRTRFSLGARPYFDDPDEVKSGFYLQFAAGITSNEFQDGAHALVYGLDAFCGHSWASDNEYSEWLFGVSLTFEYFLLLDDLW